MCVCRVRVALRRVLLELRPLSLRQLRHLWKGIGRAEGARGVSVSQKFNIEETGNSEAGMANCVWETRSSHTNNIRSEEHTSELQSLMRISSAVFCLKKKTPPKLITRSNYPL